MNTFQYIPVPLVNFFFNSSKFSLVFNSCVPCDSTCKTCFGHQSNQCLSCSLPKLLLGSSCVAECPSGMFHNQVTHTCEACHTACESCTGPRDSDCNSCRGMVYQNNSKTSMYMLYVLPPHFQVIHTVLMAICLIYVQNHISLSCCKQSSQDPS